MPGNLHCASEIQAQNLIGSQPSVPLEGNIEQINSAQAQDSDLEGTKL